MYILVLGALFIYLSVSIVNVHAFGRGLARMEKKVGKWKGCLVINGHPLQRSFLRCLLKVVLDRREGSIHKLLYCDEKNFEKRLLYSLFLKERSQVLSARTGRMGLLGRKRTGEYKGLENLQNLCRRPLRMTSSVCFL